MAGWAKRLKGISLCVFSFLYVWFIVVDPITATSTPALSDVTIPLRTAPSKFEVGYLYGSIHEYAYYFIDILVGTPPQRQSVILDSGSSLLGFPCKRCTYCGHHIDSPFNFAASSTANWMKCTDDLCDSGCGVEQRCSYYQKYSEGSSISGFYFRDLVSLGDYERKNDFVWFSHIGCHSKETKLFTTQKANGIMGVSFPKHGRQSTIVDALFGAKDVNTKVFAICIAEKGGLMTVGGYNSTFHLPSKYTYGSPEVVALASEARKLYAVGGAADVPIAWTKITSRDTFRVDLEKMIFNGHNIEGFGSSIVDSGTTFTYLSERVGSKVIRLLDAICQESPKCSRRCFSVASINDANLPSFILKFGDGASVEWKPDSYMYSAGHGKWCTAVDMNSGDSTILGASFMKNKNVIFDRNHDLIGFANAECPRHLSIERPRPHTYDSVGVTAVGLKGPKVTPSPFNTDPEFSAHNLSWPKANFISLKQNYKKTLWAVAGIALTAIVITMGVISYQTLKRRSTYNYSYMADTPQEVMEIDEEYEIPSDFSDDSSIGDEFHKSADGRTILVLPADEEPMSSPAK